MYEPITEQRMYSDSTPMIKTGGWSRIVAKADTLTVTGGSMAEFINAMFLIDAVENAGGLIKRLVLPYVPGARQDRTNPTGDVLNTANSVGRMIRERLVFGDVVILDPHSNEVVKVIGSPIIYPQSEVAKMLPNVYAGVIAADKGGKARAEAMASAMGIPVYYGGKTRDVSTGHLTGFTLEDLDNKLHYGNGHYLVVDDICDGGGTFNGLAAKIHEQGATADLYVSHGIFSKGTDALLENYGTIYTTDSLTQLRDNDVTVLPVVKKMEKYNG
jgi:ribose-phosphate pyrophosphokinase